MTVTRRLANQSLLRDDAVGGAARVFSLVATIVRAVCSVIAALIVAHAVFVLEANPANALAEFTTGWRDTVGWFTKDLFTLSDPKIAEAVDDGPAAVIRVVAGSLLSKVIVRLTPATRAKV